MQFLKLQEECFSVNFFFMRKMKNALTRSKLSHSLKLQNKIKEEEKKMSFYFHEITETIQI